MIYLEFFVVNIRISDSEDYEELKALNEVISTYETENSQLKSEIAALKSQLSKEQVKNRDVIPQYRESVARLKKNTQLVRNKLRDIQELRQSEKEEFEAKVIPFYFATGFTCCVRLLL